MELILFLVLGGALAGLWNRVKTLEARVETLQSGWPPPAAGEDRAHEPEIIVDTDPPARRAENRLVLTGSGLSERTTLYEEREAPPPDADTQIDRDGPDDRVSDADEPETVGWRGRIPAFDFEDVFGRRLPIWAGGIALAVGGIFLVLYAIDAGLLTPPVRVVLSFLFGSLLLAGAEAAYRMERLVADVRVRQALAGAGLATFYAAFYLAGAQYDLIGPAAAFLGLALVTAGALALALRFGLPTAVLGLTGGFATPLLVASDRANVPLLAFYLAALTAGLAVTGNRMGQRWLGAAALVVGFVWGVLMLLGDPGGQADRAAIGLYLLALGAVIPMLVGDFARVPFAKLAAGAIAILQMGFLVGLAGFDLLTWGLYILLACALAFLGWREASLRPAGGLVAALGIVLFAIWPDPAWESAALVGAGLSLAILGGPLVLIWRGEGGRLETVQLGLAAVMLGIVAHWHFGSSDANAARPGLALASILLSSVCAAAAWRLWARVDRSRFLAVPVGAAALLAYLALQDVLPAWAEVFGAAIVATVPAWIVSKREDRGLQVVAWGGIVLTLSALLGAQGAAAEAARLTGDGEQTASAALAALRWAAAIIPAAAIAGFAPMARDRRIAEGTGTLLLYGALAQVLPGPWLAPMAAGLGIAGAFAAPSRFGIWSVAVALAVAWSLDPFATWIEGAIEALAGIPMLVGSVPDPAVAARTLLPLSLVAAVAAWRSRLGGYACTALAAIAAGALTVGVHSAFKHVFAMVGPNDFAALGLAERTVWQGLLIALGVALAGRGRALAPGWIPLALVAAGLMHFAVFTMGWHNPLWAAQATGPVPVANLLLASYALAGAGIRLLDRRHGSNLPAVLRWLPDAALMVLVSLWALSELRHIFAGSILVSRPLGQGEDLLRSLLGIILALAFLWWGSRTGKRSWRIGSLVLMLLAVAKVFVVDAAGLEGLLRIASFMALGLSLIGIGWVYSRQLRSQAERPNLTPPGETAA